MMISDADVDADFDFETIRTADRPHGDAYLCLIASVASAVLMFAVVRQFLRLLGVL